MADEVIDLMCVRCGIVVDVQIDIDDMDDWYRLAKVCRRADDDGCRLTAPLMRQIMEEVETS